MEATNNGLLFNNLSKEMLEAIPPLKRGETAKYRVHGSYNPKTKKYSLVTAMHIPQSDVIYDTGKDDWVNIALIERMQPNGQPKFIDLWITDQTNNVIILNGSKNADQKIYRYFEMCNFNISNPNRDPSVVPLIEKIDDVANYLAEHEKHEKRRAALSVVQKWDDKKIIEYWTGIDPQVRVALKAKDGKSVDGQYLRYLKARLFDIAEQDPEKFVQIQVNKGKASSINNDDVDGIIKQAKDKSLFTLDMKLGEFKYGDGSILYKFKKGFGVSPYEELKKYFTKTDEGRKVYENLKQETIGQ